MKFLAAIVILLGVLVATGSVHFYWTSSADAAPLEEVQTVMSVVDRTDLDEATSALHELVTAAPRNRRGVILIRARLPVLADRFAAAASELRERTYALSLATTSARRLRVGLLRGVAQEQWVVGTFEDEIARKRPTWPAVSRFKARTRLIFRQWHAQIDKTLRELSAAE